MNTKQLKDLNSTDIIEENFMLLIGEYMDTIIAQSSKYDNKEMYEKYIHDIYNKLSQLCKLSVEKKSIIMAPLQYAEKRLKKEEQKENYRRMGY